MSDNPAFNDNCTCRVPQHGALRCTFCWGLVKASSPAPEGAKTATEIVAEKVRAKP